MTASKFGAIVLGIGAIFLMLWMLIRIVRAISLYCSEAFEPPAQRQFKKHNENNENKDSFFKSLKIRWARHRAEAAEKKAERNALKKRTEAIFDRFVQDSMIHVPNRAMKHPEAAKWRAVWRRARLYEQLTPLAEPWNYGDVSFDLVAIRAEQEYEIVSPRNQYGKVELKASSEQFKAIAKREMRLFIT